MKLLHEPPPPALSLLLNTNPNPDPTAGHDFWKETVLLHLTS